MDSLSHLTGMAHGLRELMQYSAHDFSSLRTLRLMFCFSFWIAAQMGQ